MSLEPGLPEDFRDLLDAYCDGSLDEAGLDRLEAILHDSAEARHEFASYFQLHTELHFAIRASQAADSFLRRFSEERPVDLARRPSSPPGRRGARPGLPRLRFWSGLAAGLLIAVVGTLAGSRIWTRGVAPRGTEGRDTSRDAENVAWLINAQDCVWAGDRADMPGRDMRAGKVLRLERGLAEVEFERGARVILKGPAVLVLLDENRARLLRGTMTARVPERARGFTVFSPTGRVVDLGTEFGLLVDGDGNTSVHVFKGEVEAAPLATASEDAGHVTLLTNQAARIDDRAVSLTPGLAGRERAGFVRAIVPPPVISPRGVVLDFARDRPGTLADAQGRGTGLTHRLPNTGAELLRQDPNLRLEPALGVLRLTTTRSDINTQDRMPTGEYLGFRLKDLGFTGREDFSVSATIPKIPGLEVVGQFGLYAGTRSDRNIRGGLISMPRPDSYGLFLVNNNGGQDTDLYEVGLSKTGDDLRITLRRVQGRYSLVVENLTEKSSSTLSIAHPEFLDGEDDLYVGLFGANTQSDVRKTLSIKQVGVTVWAVAPAGSSRGAGPAQAGRAARQRDVTEALTQARP